MGKFLIFGFLVAITMCGAIANVINNEVINEDEDLFMGIKIFEIERNCALLGGLCVERENCLEPTSTTGLCPKNQHKGVECCYELPIKQAPCKEHLGACMDHCSRLLQRPSTDCDGGQVCCVLTI